MPLANNPPDWACSQWGRYEHNWNLCAACMEAYESMIEKAQDDWVEEAHDLHEADERNPAAADAS